MGKAFNTEAVLEGGSRGQDYHEVVGHLQGALRVFVGLDDVHAQPARAPVGEGHQPLVARRGFRQVQRAQPVQRPAHEEIEQRALYVGPVLNPLQQFTGQRVLAPGGLGGCGAADGPLVIATGGALEVRLNLPDGGHDVGNAVPAVGLQPAQQREHSGASLQRVVPAGYAGWALKAGHAAKIIPLGREAPRVKERQPLFGARLTQKIVHAVACQLNDTALAAFEPAHAVGHVQQQRQADVVVSHGFVKGELHPLDEAVDVVGVGAGGCEAQRVAVKEAEQRTGILEEAIIGVDGARALRRRGGRYRQPIGQRGNRRAWQPGRHIGGQIDDLVGALPGAAKGAPNQAVIVEHLGCALGMQPRRLALHLGGAHIADAPKLAREVGLRHLATCAQ